MSNLNLKGVWIPVSNIVNFYTIRGYYNGSLDSESTYCSEPYTTEVAEYNRMKTSVENNHGFYIGRYETGKIDNQVVVKKDTTVYNNIK